MPSALASCLASSVLPTPVGPVKRNEPIGFLGARRPARESLMALASSLIACPARRRRRASDVFEIAQLQLVGRRHLARRDLRHLGDHRFDVGDVDLGALAVRELRGGARLVEQVDGLVGQLLVVQVPIGERGRGLDGLGGVGDAVELFVARLQALQDERRLLDARLAHLDLLEAPRERAVALDVRAVLLERGRADAADLARRERGLEQVRRVQRAAGGRAGAHDRVHLVDEEDAPRALLERLDHGLEALFEVAAELGAGEERAHVERVDARVGERLGHLLLVDAQREALDDGRLADARVADEERVVLAAAREDLDGALDLVLAADERIDVTLRRPFAPRSTQ